MVDIEAAFQKYIDDEYLEFDRVETRLSNRPDLHAFILLDRLVPGTSDIVSAAEHDEFFLDVDLSSLAEVANEEDIRELVRCGVRISDEYDCLAMFV
jgi:hypothetical protein